MLDNEYVTLYEIRARIRGAEAKGAFYAMLQEARPRPERPDGGWVTWLERRWHEALAWAAQLALPKPGIRL
ncbi:MAG TPA: hypothetical protein VH741_11855 [Candidatus Limnocylindrales bacterium]